MRKNLHITLLLMMALFAVPVALSAQYLPDSQRDISEGSLMITILSDQIIRVQYSASRDFAVTPGHKHQAMKSEVQVARHEDRLQLESPFFSFVHIPQNGITKDRSPWVTTPYVSEKVFLLSDAPMHQHAINKGILIIDNLHDKLFPVSEAVESDRIVIFSDNTFNTQIIYLRELSGKDFKIKDACATPQIYFKPVKGSARLQIESSPGATIYFTRDGSTPNYRSEKYVKPELLKSSARVVAFATDSKNMPSEISEAQIVMSKAREIEWRHDYSPEYCGLGEYALMDGIKGDSEDFRRNWIGIPEDNMSVEVELNRPMALSMVGVRFFQQPEKGIFIPAKVTIEVSCDGRRFHKVYRHRIKIPDAPYNHWTHSITARFNAREVKYIRVYAEASDKIKSQEHFLDGMKWIFVDEITYEQQPDKEGLGPCRGKK